MKVLVTGVSGFIGGRIANDLVKKNYEVLGNGRSKFPENDLSSKVQYITGSLDDPKVCAHITKDIDLVIHCAGKAGAWGSYQSFYEANVRATRQLLEAAKKMV